MLKIENFLIYKHLDPQNGEKSNLKYFYKDLKIWLKNTKICKKSIKNKSG